MCVRTTTRWSKTIEIQHARVVLQIFTPKVRQYIHVVIKNRACRTGNNDDLVINAI